MTRARWLTAGRVTFLVACAVFAWWSFRGRGDELWDAVQATEPWRIGVAFALVLAGLLPTGFLWLLVLARYGHRLSVGRGLSIFFTGQLGKYVPGSVWSLGAQAHLARDSGVPARTTVATGLVFLGYHVATGIAIAAAIDVLGDLDVPWHPGLSAVALLIALAGMAPPVVCRLGRGAAGTDSLIGWRDTASVLALMTATWISYSVALVLLLPEPRLDRLAVLAAAFTAAYAAGVVIVLAPAGLGAREAIFIALAAPVTGFAAAGSVALLARAVHTAADGAWGVAAMAGSSIRADHGSHDGGTK